MTSTKYETSKKLLHAKKPPIGNAHNLILSIISQCKNRTTLHQIKGDKGLITKCVFLWTSIGSFVGYRTFFYKAVSRSYGQIENDKYLYVWIGGEFDKITVWVAVIMTIQLPDQTYTYSSTRERVDVKSY
jgi:hypothetical protein